MHNDKQHDKRNQVEEKNSYFVDRHGCIVSGIKLFRCQSEPFVVEPIEVVVCINEDEEPDDEHDVVDDCAP